MIDTNGKFYLGRLFEPQSKKLTEQPLLYDPADLTTHAVVVGMTGSGKTGLCIDLLEEAALNNIPALMIDPKGDITNTLLHFPGMLADDFQPWINADDARREGKSVQQAAVDTASLWKKGLSEWGIGPERVRALQKAAQFTVYTPGSDAGVSVSILANLKAPEIPWQNNREILREKISGTVTAILGLVGLDDIDPVRSREHILLSNVFEYAWSRGRDLDLGELIMQTQTPPFEKLGVFDINTFFPEKDRFELAMLLNNILAAPTFQTWLEGHPLDIQSLLFDPDGRPRHCVFYIAHLPDAERMFFVTLLYSAVETWMRTQTGTNTLRAIIYFDEIFGYLPPVSNPPSKQPMLRMLKQARAFGVGQVLVTQNPVDVDYKALSNAGTWFIGKLQTERDKERLLDGLQGAAPNLDRRVYDQMISTLGKRVFLLHNVHENTPQVFNTRWAMNYLAGPLTRAQIPQLNALAGVSETPLVKVRGRSEPKVGVEDVPLSATSKPIGEISPVVESPAATMESPMGTTTRPAIPSGIEEYFLPNNLTLSQALKSSKRNLSQGLRQSVKNLGIRYRPVLLAQAEVRFLQRKYNLDHDTKRTTLVEEPDRRGSVRWRDWLADPINSRILDPYPISEALFSSVGGPLNDGKTLRALKTNFIDWVYRTTEVFVCANETLKVFSGPEISAAEFRSLCSEAAREKRDTEAERVMASFRRKIETLKDRLAREKRELREDEAELSQRKMEELGTHAENILSLFSGRSRRRVSTSLSKRRMTERAKADVEESLDEIEEYEKKINDLKREITDTMEELNDKWGEIAKDSSEISVHPYKKDVLIDLFGVAWFPYYVVDAEGREREIPGFGKG